MKKEIADRLEIVRSREGLSMVDFWAKLIDGVGDVGQWLGKDGEPCYSYRGATRYHNGKRLAPVDYLKRVSDVFGAPVEWLVSGEGTALGGAMDVRGLLHGVLRLEPNDGLLVALKDDVYFSEADTDAMRVNIAGPLGIDPKAILFVQGVESVTVLRHSRER